MPKSYLGLQFAKAKNTLPFDKSFASFTSRSGSLGRSGRNLKTPIRRFFKLELLRSRTSRNEKNRVRTRDRNTACGQPLDPLAATPPPPSDPATSPTTVCDTPDKGQDLKDSSPPQQPRTAPCVALQNPDSSIDAVVISTLLKLPFCCHEDLLTMPPTRVIEIAQEMNERLPEALRIDLKAPRDPNRVRRELEKLVGIVKKANEVQVPGAPLKRASSRGRQILGKVLDKDIFHGQDLSTISPPTSPLAAISATRGIGRVVEADVTMIMNPRELGILQEDDEDGDTNMMGVEGEESEDAQIDEDEDFFRVAKKRRTSDSPKDVQMTTPIIRQVKVPLAFKNIYEDINTSPSPRRTLRSRTQSKVTFDESSILPVVAANRIAVGSTVIDRSLVNTRARYRSSNKFSRIQKATQLGRGQGPLQTSTPKANRRGYRNGSFENNDGEGF